MKKITDKQEALNAVSEDGMRLEECSDELRNDKDVVEEAVRNREKAIMFVSDELQSNEEVIRSAFVRNVATREDEGESFSSLSDKVKDNEELILLALTFFNSPIKYISDRLKNDEAFLAKACAVNFYIFEHIESKYLKSKSFIRKILKILHTRAVHTVYVTDSFARLLDETILDNEAMMKEIIEKAGYKNFKFLSDRLKENKDYLIELLASTPKVYELFNYKFWDDKDIALSAVGGDGMNLYRVSRRLKEDREIVLKAVQNNPHSIQFAADSFQDDKELWAYVTKDDRYYYSLVDPRNGRRYDIPMLMSNDPGYVFKYIRFMKQKEQSPDTFEKMLRWD